MRVLIDVNHPAHVHTLRPIVAAFRARGDDVRATARDKDVTLQLLARYGIPAQVLAPVGRGRLGQLRELLVREVRFLRLARAYRPHLILGSSVHAGRAGALFGAVSVLLNEDDAAVIPLYRFLAYPLVTAVVTPDCLSHERHGRRHITYPSYHELFYLHPNRFTPDPGVRGELGLVGDEPYAVVRLSGLAAHHDAGLRGLGEGFLTRLLERARGRVRVFISSERPLPAPLDLLRLRLPPERVHDALAFALFFLGDSQTMAVEASVLGTPAFQVSDLVGRLSVLNELGRYGLCVGVRPGHEDQLLPELDGLLDAGARSAEFESRRRRLLADKTDPLPWFLGTVDALLAERARRG